MFHKLYFFHKYFEIELSYLSIAYYVLSIIYYLLFIIYDSSNFTITIQLLVKKILDDYPISGRMYTLELMEVSPAIDAGVYIPGITNQINGAAPDIDAYEFPQPGISLN